MSVDPFHLNRPVHLARRDVFYDQARLLIERLPAHKDPADQHKTADKALARFQKALFHAEAANQSQQATDEDLLFTSFLVGMVDNMESIAHMLRRQRAVDSKNSASTRFLNSGDVREKMTAHYRRCAAHILKGLLLMLPQAEPPYRKLMESTFEKMTADDRTRYEKAREHLLSSGDS
jgi:hypothetical protein